MRKGYSELPQRLTPHHIEEKHERYTVEMRPETPFGILSKIKAKLSLSGRADEGIH